MRPNRKASRVDFGWIRGDSFPLMDSSSATRGAFRGFRGDSRPRSTDRFDLSDPRADQPRDAESSPDERIEPAWLRTLDHVLVDWDPID